MNINKYYSRFASVLSIINQHSITSKEELDAPCNEALCVDLWYAAQDFINHYALASKTHRNSKSEIVEGNAEKIRTLVSRGFDLNDIRGDILAHVFSKMDHILAQPLEKQVFYVYRTINNCVYDQLRKLPPTGVVVMSLQDKVKGADASSENGSEIQDFIADPNTLEDEVIAKETVNELYLVKKAEIIREISLLADRPAEVLARLCAKHLAMKPAAIARMLAEYGASTAYAKALMSVADKFGIQADEIRKPLSFKAITDESLKLDTGDENQISAQVSRLVYRADKRLCG